MGKRECGGGVESGEARGSVSRSNGGARGTEKKRGWVVECEKDANRIGRASETSRSGEGFVRTSHRTTSRPRSFLEIKRRDAETIPESRLYRVDRQGEIENAESVVAQNCDCSAAGPVNSSARSCRSDEDLVEERQRARAVRERQPSPGRCEAGGV